MHFHSVKIISMDNNIQFIDQQLEYLRSLISQCKAQSAAVAKRLADTIITLEMKRIEAIHAIEKRLGELRSLIPVYKRWNNIRRCARKANNWSWSPTHRSENKTIFTTSTCSTPTCITSICTTTNCTTFACNKSTRIAVYKIKRYGRNSH